MVVGNGMERNPNIFSQDYPTQAPWSNGGPWSRGNEPHH